MALIESAVNHRTANTMTKGKGKNNRNNGRQNTIQKT